MSDPHLLQGGGLIDVTWTMATRSSCRGLPLEFDKEKSRAWQTLPPIPGREGGAHAPAGLQ